MRQALRELTQIASSHLYGSYNRFAPILDWNPNSETRGKISTAPNGNAPSNHDQWMDRLGNVLLDADYIKAYERWKNALAADDSTAYACKMESRLLIGHGLPSASEVGLFVHHTWGAPLIPGSALKGLLANYIQTVYGPEETERSPYDPQHPQWEKSDPQEQARISYQGVGWKGTSIARPPGDIYTALFGAPPLMEKEVFFGHPNTLELMEGRKGGLFFHDAWYIPEGTAWNTPFVRDVLTVHQKSYYDAENGGTGPNDYDNPIPVSFLTVKPGAMFLLAISGEGEWARFAFECLREALVWWGVGGKTSLGYGRIQQSDTSWQEKVSPKLAAAMRAAEQTRIAEEKAAQQHIAAQQQARNSDEYAELEAWFAAKKAEGLGVNPWFQAFDEAWGKRLSSFPVPLRAVSKKLIRAHIQRVKKNGARYDELMTLLGKG